MNKKRKFLLLSLLLEYLNKEHYISFETIYEEEMSVNDLIENLMQDYMR